MGKQIETSVGLKWIAEVEKKAWEVDKQELYRDRVYGAEELQHALLLKEGAELLRQTLKHWNLERKRAFSQGYLRVRSCSEAKLGIEHRKIEDV